MLAFYHLRSIKTSYKKLLFIYKVLSRLHCTVENINSSALLRIYLLIFFLFSLWRHCYIINIYVLICLILLNI